MRIGVLRVLAARPRPVVLARAVPLRLSSGHSAGLTRDGGVPEVDFNKPSIANGFPEELLKRHVVIYLPAKSASQHGSGGRKWMVRFGTPSQWQNPLMGWNAGGDTGNQVNMTFESKEAAIKYAESQGLHYTVDDAHEKKLKPKAYSDNFASKFYGIRPTKK